MDPPLTTVNQPFYEMGKKAAEILVRIIRDGMKSAGTSTITLRAELIIRGSTK